MFSQGSVCLQGEGVHPPGQTPPPKPLGRPPSPEMATAVDGTHPTGMHSC